MLGCSGSYGAPGGGACSGYLLRVGRHRRSGSTAATARSATCRSTSTVEDLTAVVLTHGHPDHCVDIYGLHVLLRYGLGTREPAGLRARGAREVPAVAGDRLGRHLRLARGRRRRHRRRSATSTLRFSRTDHPPPTYAVEAHRRRPAADLHRRHRARAGRSARSSPVPTSCCRRRRTCTPTSPRRSTCRPSRPAKRRARRGAQRLILTHLWPHARPERESPRRAPRRSAAPSPSPRRTWSLPSDSGTPSA